ncbi:MAG: hypothetical protein ACLU9S_11240 [Oscillospiraceae bacterium]
MLVYARMISERNQIAGEVHRRRHRRCIHHPATMWMYRSNIIVSNAAAEAAKLEAEGARPSTCVMPAEAFQDTPDVVNSAS